MKIQIQAHVPLYIQRDYLQIMIDVQKGTPFIFPGRCSHRNFIMHFDGKNYIVQQCSNAGFFSKMAPVKMNMARAAKIVFDNLLNAPAVNN